jgi:hypothetical protein
MDRPYFWIVQARLSLLEMKVREGHYPVVSWERRDLAARRGPWVLRLCQYCGDTIRTWGAHPGEPVNCNICSVMPKKKGTP